MRAWSLYSSSESTNPLPWSSTHGHRLRAACQDYIFIDFGAAAKKGIEQRLWAAHMKVNATFRPFLASFREEDGQKLKVERRKAEKLYLGFIKSSQSFYRGYIQRLASNFKDVPEILSLARAMQFDSRISINSHWSLTNT